MASDQWEWGMVGLHHEIHVSCPTVPMMQDVIHGGHRHLFQQKSGCSYGRRKQSWWSLQQLLSWKYIYIYWTRRRGYSCQHLQPTGAAWVRCRADHAPPKGIGHIRTTVTISEGLQRPVKPGVTKAWSSMIIPNYMFYGSSKYIIIYHNPYDDHLNSHHKSI